MGMAFADTRTACTCTSVWCNCGTFTLIYGPTTGTTGRPSWNDPWFTTPASSYRMLPAPPAPWARWFDVFRTYLLPTVPRSRDGVSAWRHRITQHVGTIARRRWKRGRFVQLLRATP